MFKEMPLVELRIRHLGEEIVNVFAARAKELVPYIRKAVDAALSPENIQREIGDMVDKCVRDSILASLGGWQVRGELQKIISNELSSRLQSKQGAEQE